MDLTKLSKKDLLVKCEDLGIIKCKSKNKIELIDLIINLKKPNIEIMFKNNDYITLIDLFTGTGAFSYAFHQTNKVKTIFANDILESSKEIFDLNNEIKLIKKDLLDINNNDIPNSFILTAGFRNRWT